MRCPSCGYLSLQPRPRCRRCGTALGAAAEIAPPLPFPEESPAPEAERPPEEKGRAPRRTSRRRAVAPREPAAQGTLDLATPPAPAPAADPVEELAGSVEMDAGGPSSPRSEILPGTPLEEEVIPLPALAGRVARTGAAEAIVDRDDEVPEEFWTPERTSFGRRLVALATDLAILAALLGAFGLAAAGALRFTGTAPGLPLAPRAWQAALLPFGLLALLLSFAYFVFFHGWSGATPGKRLAGVRLRGRDGQPATYGDAALRWVGALASLACAGAGFLWALRPHGLGWPDLLSDTVLAAHRARRPER